MVNNSEIPELSGYNGRIAFQRHMVRGEFGDFQVFPDQGSGASFVAASRVMDMISLLLGRAGEQGDAPQAYAHCEMGIGMHDRAHTWPELPYDWWPEECKKKRMRRPVVPLVVALCGHPPSGRCWENYCDNELQMRGSERVQGWECL